jgi:hypothetical protein
MAMTKAEKKQLEDTQLKLKLAAALHANLRPAQSDDRGVSEVLGR